MFLRRYTNLAATIHLLREKTITLLNPATWDDKNDAYFMAEYKRYMNAKTVLALCFAERSETYHHWRVYSHGMDGVCIEFDKQKLLSTFDDDSRIKEGYVEYKMIKALNRMKNIEVGKLPFLKRYAYEDESEYRVIYTDYRKAMEFEEYDIRIPWINRIILSPWIPKTLAVSVARTLRAIEGCPRLRISRSSLVDNEAWKEATARVRVNSGEKTP